MQHQATIRQIDLLGREGDVQLATQEQSLVGLGASALAAGDLAGVQAAYDKDSQNWQSAVDAHQKYEWQKQEGIQKFRRALQTSAATMGFDSLDSDQNRAMIDQLNNHPERFPDLAKGEIRELIDRGEREVKNHKEQKEWQDARTAKAQVDKQIVPASADPRTGYIDVAKAESLIAGMPADQRPSALEALRTAVATHNAAAEQKLLDTHDQIASLAQKGDFSKAFATNDTLQVLASQIGSPAHADNLHFIQQAQREFENQKYQRATRAYTEEAREELKAARELRLNSTAFNAAHFREALQGHLDLQAMDDAITKGNLNTEVYESLRKLNDKAPDNPSMGIAYDLALTPFEITNKDTPEVAAVKGPVLNLVRQEMDKLRAAGVDGEELIKAGSTLGELTAKKVNQQIIDQALAKVLGVPTGGAVKVKVGDKTVTFPDQASADKFQKEVGSQTGGRDWWEKYSDWREKYNKLSERMGKIGAPLPELPPPPSPLKFKKDAGPD